MTISSCKRFLIFFSGLIFLASGCASKGQIKTVGPRMDWAGAVQVESEGTRMEWAREGNSADGAQAQWAGPRIAVLPLHSMTTGAAPLKELETMVTDHLRKRGVSILEKEVLDKFMARRRMRYTGGLDKETALALMEETGVEAALISTLEFFEGGGNPRISMHARLVSTGADPEIMWMDVSCRAGDDSPGLLNLGIISDPNELMEITSEELAESMLLHLAGKTKGQDMKKRKKGIRPTNTFRTDGLSTDGTPKVAVLPFLNLSERINAWEVVPMHLIKQLLDTSDFQVLEPGVVRKELLDSRVTVEGGLSKPHLELVVISSKADLVVTGTVMEYVESGHTAADPVVQFSVKVFDSKSEEITWSSGSIGTGGEGVYFFGAGKRSTACELAEELARTTVSEIVAQQ